MKKKITRNWIHSSIVLGLLLAHLNTNAQTNAACHYTKPLQMGDGIVTGDVDGVGIDSSMLITLANLVLNDSFPNIHSVLIAKDNKLVYESYFAGADERWGLKLGVVQHDATTLHDIRSITKSVVSACVGIAIEQKKIKSIDDPIFNYLPNYAAYKTSDNSFITIRNLLTMSSGIDWDEDAPHGTNKNNETQMERAKDPVAYVLSQKMATKPGQAWNYNSGGVQVLAQIIKTATGITVDSFAAKYIFNPLGIQKYYWAQINKGFPAAASGLRLTSRDLLKFGLLYMNNGKWQGGQIIPKHWVEETWAPKISRNGQSLAQGYSYLFWAQVDSVQTKAFEILSAKGNGNQRLFMNKKLHLLVAITAGNYNNDTIVNNAQKAFDKYILPAVYPSR